MVIGMVRKKNFGDKCSECCRCQCHLIVHDMARAFRKHSSLALPTPAQAIYATCMSPESIQWKNKYSNGFFYSPRPPSSPESKSSYSQRFFFLSIQQQNWRSDRFVHFAEKHNRIVWFHFVLDFDLLTYKYDKTIEMTVACRWKRTEFHSQPFTQIRKNQYRWCSFLWFRICHSVEWSAHFTEFLSPLALHQFRSDVAKMVLSPQLIGKFLLSRSYSPKIDVHISDADDAIFGQFDSRWNLTFPRSIDSNQDYLRDHWFDSNWF